MVTRDLFVVTNFLVENFVFYNTVEGHLGHGGKYGNGIVPNLLLNLTAKIF